MKKPVVSLVKYVSSPDSLAEALEYIDSFQKLGNSNRVMIKPNLVGWDPVYPIAPYGVYTTSRLVEDMIILLKERGVDDITIGEGSSHGWGEKGKAKKGAGLIFDALGYGYLKERYGVKLIDFFDEPFKKVEVGGFELGFATSIFEADYFINMPTFKTHSQTVLSLGLKNLKGCIDIKSRRFCHNKEVPLDFFCSLFADVIRPSLTVLDGIYALEKGPFYLGTAHRTNLIMASEDILGIDALGAIIAGYEPASIEHLKSYAERHNRSLSLDTFDVKGPDPETVKRPLKFDFRWREDNSGPAFWDKSGVTGIKVPKYDKTICTGCSANFNTLLMLITAAYMKAPFEGVEVLSGKNMSPSPGFRKTVLFGNCMIKKNRKDPNIKEPVYLKGCPVNVEEIVNSLGEMGIAVDPSEYARFRESIAKRYDGDSAFEPDHYFMPGAMGDPRFDSTQ
jgi:uncharacterized protein (DUF362 family)